MSVKKSHSQRALELLFQHNIRDNKQIESSGLESLMRRTTTLLAHA